VVSSGADAPVVELPLALDVPQLAADEFLGQSSCSAHDFLAPHESAAPSGRTLRARISSLLC
jgi:hypothetical protein